MIRRAWVALFAIFFAHRAVIANYPMMRTPAKYDVARSGAATKNGTLRSFSPSWLNTCLGRDNTS